MSGVKCVTLTGLVCIRFTFRFMFCETKVEERGWDIESRIQFTSEGLVNTVTSKRDNVMMRAHYRDGSDDLLSSIYRPDRLQ